MQNKRKTEKPIIDWEIHGCANGVTCDLCGETEIGYMPGTCNFHTHGMEKYHHMDFQMILAYPPKEICRILNTLGLRVQAGEKFKNGDMVAGIYEDCDVRLTEFEETGRTVLRVIVPDKNNRFPEDPECDGRYALQLFTTDFIYRNGGWKICE